MADAALLRREQLVKAERAVRHGRGEASHCLRLGKAFIARDCAHASLFHAPLLALACSAIRSSLPCSSPYCKQLPLAIAQHTAPWPLAAAPRTSRPLSTKPRVSPSCWALTRRQHVQARRRACTSSRRVALATHLGRPQAAGALTTRAGGPCSCCLKPTMSHRYELCCSLQQSASLLSWPCEGVRRNES